MSSHESARPPARQERRPSAMPGELMAGSRRPGQTLPTFWAEEAYANWFFDFLRADLGTLTEGQLLGMRVDAVRFLDAADQIEGLPGTDGLPSAEQLAALQLDANEGLRRVLKGEWYHLEKGISHGVARMGDRLVRGRRSGSLSDLFRAAAMDVLQATWKRLHRCPKCSSIFLKVGKKKYCSPLCASRTHWERFKANRAHRDHHREYESRTRKRLGKHVKVGTRSRRQK